MTLLLTQGPKLIVSSSSDSEVGPFLTRYVCVMVESVHLDFVLAQDSQPTISALTSSIVRGAAVTTVTGLARLRVTSNTKSNKNVKRDLIGYSFCMDKHRGKSEKDLYAHSVTCRRQIVILAYLC